MSDEQQDPKSPQDGIPGAPAGADAKPPEANPAAEPKPAVESQAAETKPAAELKSTGDARPTGESKPAVAAKPAGDAKAAADAKLAVAGDAKPAPVAQVQTLEPIRLRFAPLSRRSRSKD